MSCNASSGSHIIPVAIAITCIRQEPSPPEVPSSRRLGLENLIHLPLANCVMPLQAPVARCSRWKDKPSWQSILLLNLLTAHSEDREQQEEPFVLVVVVMPPSAQAHVPSRGPFPFCLLPSSLSPSRCRSCLRQRAFQQFLSTGV